MSRSLGRELPTALFGALGEGRLEDREGLALLLLTIRDDGWPHLAMLSAGEVVAFDRRRLGIALWPGSTATRNLSQRGRATLAAVLEETSFTARLAVRPAGELETPRAGKLARFEAEVEEAAADVAPYAVLESGVRFRLKDPDEVLARWGEVRAALREDVADG